MMSLTWNLKYDANKLIYNNRLRDMENTAVAAQEAGEGEYWSLGY